MKTTDIFVEQVLIGLMIIATGALPYMKWETLGTTWTDIGKGVGIIALAYLLGIIFDRFADTLLSRFEQYNRLKFAAELLKIHEAPSDPYPEDHLRAKILTGNGGGATEWMEYLRSRIRLSRALTVFIPALTLSGLITVRSDCAATVIPEGIILGVIASVYAFIFIGVLRVSKDKNRKLPKTWDKDLKLAINNFSWKREPTTMGASLLAFIAVILVTSFAIKDASSLLKTLPILLAGLGISVLSAWSWWRISLTFMKFMIVAQNNGEDEENNKPIKTVS